MKGLCTWLAAAASGCVFVFALPAAGASSIVSGALDTSFGTGDGIFTWAGNSGYSWASASALQPDGKIVLVGQGGVEPIFDYGPPQQTQVIVARITADGSLDPSFGTGGNVAIQVGLGATPSSGAESVALQPDGKIVVGGWATDALGNRAFMIARLTDDGGFDPTFGTQGTVTAPSLEGVAALMRQPDGKVLAAGGGFVARLNADGSFDNSFASGGVQSATGVLSALALQPDGKIVAAGDSYSAFLIVRLDADGSPDATFGSNGIVASQLGAGAAPYSRAEAVLMQPDGKIVAGGSCTDTNGNNQVLVARLDGSGHFDSSFGSGGAVIAQPSEPVPYPRSVVQALALQPNGKILAAGSASAAGFYPTDKTLAMRLDAHGNLDTSFGTGGLVTSELTMYGSGFTSLALQPDGKVLAAGGAVVHYGHFIFVERLIVDLPPSASFGGSPLPATAGQTVTFDGSGSSDTDGSITGYAWGFGDGATATGSNPTHVYTTAGTYTLTLTVTDDYGLTNTAAAAVTVRPPVPVLSGLRSRPHAFRAAKHGGSIARHGGTTVSYHVSIAGKTRFTIHRVLDGRVKGAVRSSFVHQDHVGANSFHFTGRLGSQRLRSGSYRLDATPTANGRTGATRHISFRITR